MASPFKSDRIYIKISNTNINQENYTLVHAPIYCTLTRTGQNNDDHSQELIIHVQLVKLVQLLKFSPTIQLSNFNS